MEVAPSNTPSISEPNKAGIETDKSLVPNIPPVENGGIDQPNPLDAGALSADAKSPEDAKPTNESKMPEPQPIEQKSTNENEHPRAPALEEKPESPQVCDKREQKSTPFVCNADQLSNEDSTEPARKRQKKSEGHGGATNGTLVPDPEERERSEAAKQKGGRSKKSKSVAKKEIPTDGIGSRTRSRTKAVSYV